MERFKKLTLLHSNDMHGDFLAEQVDDKLVGGVSMLSGYINKVREEEPNALYCIAGDMFRGSVIDSEYQGLSTIEIINTLAPDVVTIGNHETDYGLAHLLFIEKCANFPIINANLHIMMNGKRLFKPYELIEIDGMKILFIGVLTEDVLANTKNEGIISTFINVEDAAKEVGKICNAFNAIDIDFTVLLTHIGFEEDKKLANLLDPSWGIDVIIGGHSHTFLDKPFEVNGIPIVQAGIGTDQIGRFDILIDTDNNCIDSYAWKTIPINNENCPINEKMFNLIKSLKEKTDLKYERVICKFPHIMHHENRHEQTELGSYMSDIVAKSLGIDLFMFCSGSIRKQRLDQIFTYRDLVECIPYDEPIFQLLIKPEQLKQMFLYMFRDEAWEGDHTEFYQITKGFEIEYSKVRHKITKFNYNGAPIKEGQTFTVAFAQYHFINFSEIFGLDRSLVEENQNPRTISTSVQDVIDENLSKGKGELDPNWKSRIVIKEI